MLWSLAAVLLVSIAIHLMAVDVSYSRIMGLE